ncbi:alpha/beta hydrolase [Sphingobacterium sp.]|uniref:alpha/beta hydrolase n=1 Tax=Sphingobacterium sp. TaxID=341027 RepID=UPI00258CD76B|nr:alpha/beta hydrolase [Sphingobacterium sp.]WET71825.1 MAG: alpha/beta hydrolase [Sphingobacterium sp.]
MFKKIRFKNGAIEMVGNIFFPTDFDETIKYPAIVVGHPAGGVKEQTAEIYASKMADRSQSL